MKISRNWLQTYFKKDIPDANKLAELFTFHSFEVEEVENIGGDSILDLKVLPDRAHYALSHYGIAKEISYITSIPIEKRYVQGIDSNITDKPEIKIENPDFCRRYVARIIELGNIPKESPQWLKNALQSIGQRVISPIVDITNYVMYDIGQPLHAFDADKVKGGLYIRSAKQGEKITLLDGREITLTVDDSVIADEQGALVIAGAKGGKRAEIDSNTKRIIIESANFHPTKIRKTSTKYDIRSDSSKRFENEISSELAIHGINNTCKMLLDIIPESKFGPIVDVYPKKAGQTKIKFDPSYLRERLGIDIPTKTTKEILEGMEITVSEEGSSSWLLTIPFERLDLTIKNDIVEEIGRIYGYDKIKGVLPPKTNPEKEILPIFYISELIKTILINSGFSEVSLYSLVESGHVETLKPLAKDKAFARSGLTVGMMDALVRNTLNADLLDLDTVKIFEIGNIFTEETEKTHLVIGISQVKKVKGVKTENILNETVKKIGEVLGLDVSGEILDPRFRGDDNNGGKNIKQSDHGNKDSNRNYLGKIVTGKTGDSKVIEIDLDALITKYKGDFDLNRLELKPASTNKFKRFSIYPYMVRDIAVFVPETVSSEELWKVIEQGISSTNSLEILARYSLFDTFKKEGKTSYAFRLIFQSMDKTLTDEETNKVMEVVTNKIKERGWEVR